MDAKYLDILFVNKFFTNFHVQPRFMKNLRNQVVLARKMIPGDMFLWEPALTNHMIATGHNSREGSKSLLH